MRNHAMYGLISSVKCKIHAKLMSTAFILLGNTVCPLQTIVITVPIDVSVSITSDDVTMVAGATWLACPRAKLIS